MCFQKGVTALMVASHKGHVDVVKKLLEHGTRIDLQNEVCNMTDTHLSQ